MGKPNKDESPSRGIGRVADAVDLEVLGKELEALHRKNIGLREELDAAKKANDALCADHLQASRESKPLWDYVFKRCEDLEKSTGFAVKSPAPKEFFIEYRHPTKFTDRVSALLLAERLAEVFEGVK